MYKTVRNKYKSSRVGEDNAVFHKKTKKHRPNSRGAAAIASLPVHAVLRYIAPILAMVILGLAVTFLSDLLLCYRLFDIAPFERAVAIWGTETGVFLTGLMLLKICDPDYELPVLNDYSVGFSLNSVTGFILLPLCVNMMLHAGFLQNLGLQLGLIAVYAVVIAGAQVFSKKAA